MTTLDERAVNPALTALLNAHRVCGELINSLPSEAGVVAWEISGKGLRAQSNRYGTSDEDIRNRTRSTAAILNLVYSETRYPTYTHVCAVGEIDGVRVEIWDHVERQYDRTGGAA